MRYVGDIKTQQNLKLLPIYFQCRAIIMITGNHSSIDEGISRL